MITVLMATYQGRQYLEQQLDTILAQTVPVKILISDDGSDDGTREMLDNYAGWYPEQVVLHHRTEHTGGAAGNFFWLMQEALKDEKNEYILFSDQDDVWENDKVSVMLHRMKVLEKGLGRQCPILLYSDMEVVDEELYEISPSFASYTGPQQLCGAFGGKSGDRRSLHDQPGAAYALREGTGGLLHA